EVLFESDNLTDGYVLEILPRRNELVRPRVANVDLGVVVMSMVSPNFSFNLLDRFLVSLEYKDIEPVIYLTKVDLLDEPQRQQVTEIKLIYEALGYAVIASEDVEATKDL
ncbi:GTPase RsgA, partial [Enterococcus faecalis]|uniref:GTPase RsgA n=1 Tax=Enterococcus faecalis TaxID=1351 RepID=UPI003CC56A8B